ncbi:hypothetical protein ACFFX1_39135 [Dactylosporangium sucinum]|uniref:Uncharacterized protein n=1 Tax=Dactylosporangium sucinum TaxID=1424081 RepID=A0A917SZM2_9ACTN|nr:hypothetical protein [Dactylosporangium sucinum]GGM03843.1 hypothetical protein GCM10007977_001490 [Dactylosporangium sucinum]
MNPVTFDQILPAIMAGQPGSFSTAAAAFDKVVDTLETLSANVSSSVDGVIGSGRSWNGPASTAFGSIVGDLVAFVGETAKPLGPYGGALTAAGDALVTAQSEIQEYASWVQSVRAAQPRTVTEETINAGAQAILERLAAAYRTAGGSLAPIPATPADIAGDGGAGQDAERDGGAGADGDGSAGDDVPGGEEAGAAGGEGSDGDVPGVPAVGSYSLLGGPPGAFAGGSSPGGDLGLPSFALTSGSGNPSTILTGLPGPLGGTASLPPLPASPPIDPAPQAPLVPGLGAGYGGTPAPGGGGAASQRRSVLTSVGRLPGLGSDGYTRAPDAHVSVRSGSVPPLWSQYGAAAGDRRRERTTSLTGDEDWTGPSAADGAIGRPVPPAPESADGPAAD